MKRAADTLIDDLKNRLVKAEAIVQLMGCSEDAKPPVPEGTLSAAAGAACSLILEAMIAADLIYQELPSKVTPIRGAA